MTRPALTTCVTVLLLAACTSDDPRSTGGRSRPTADASPGAPTSAETSSSTVDGSPDDGSTEEAADGGRRSPLAPSEALPGETRLREEEEEHQLSTGATPEVWGAPLRVDAREDEHIGARLQFEPATASVVLQVLAWDGAEARPIGETNWAPGLRFVAAFDPFGPRTFWFRARGTIGQGDLTITRTVLDDGARCSAECDRLLQLPFPIDGAAQGYLLAEDSVYAYQFGRRELLTAIFNAGRRVAEAGVPPFEVKRLSRWDGGQPPSHESHEYGIDVDISLYRTSGEAVWFPLCRNAGRHCVPRSRADFGGRQMAILIGGLFESGIFGDRPGAVVLIDREYHRTLRSSADALAREGRISPEVQGLFSPRSHLFHHVEPHHHHIHVRVDNPEAIALRRQRRPRRAPSSQADAGGNSP